MKLLSLLSAAALVLLTDAFVLIGVSRNRSATTEEIELTERELPLQAPGEDNTGVSLRLTHIGAIGLGWQPSAEKAGWFDQAKLAEIGFDVRVPLTDPAAEIRYRDVLPRDAFVVLEYGGPAWEEWVQQQAEVPTWNPRNQTHLIAIDAGRDPIALRRKYPDPAKYLVVRTVVSLVYQTTWDANKHQRIPPKFLHGEIQTIAPNEIHVPLPEAGALSGLPVDRRTPRYAVTLRYGTHYEPWVVKIRRL